MFEYCVGIILEHEGGLSNDKNDPGGITKWGVSLRFLRAIGLDIDKDGDIDGDDILALTKPRAISVYKLYWWDKYQYHNFKNKDVAAKVFDLSVNMGAKAAHKILQVSINRLLPDSQKVEVDGILGRHTFEAANQLNPLKLRERMRQGARAKYQSIIDHNPKLEVYSKGWMNRAEW